MTHRTVNEWGRVQVGENGFSRAQADELLAAARAHPSGGREGTAILSDHHRHLTARQTVGILAGHGCSLEILPKVDPDARDENAATVRSRLVHMLDVALGLGLSAGSTADMARQSETLLDILIRLFADRLLAEARRGLPRRYQNIEDDLPALRGRLHVVKQFTKNAVRPDRLACQFDALSSNTPMLQIMKACVVFLSPHARSMETQRTRLERDSEWT
jgi:5-methylcytosine-specific restriction enzyme subunit McrC